MHDINNSNATWNILNGLINAYSSFHLANLIVSNHYVVSESHIMELFSITLKQKPWIVRNGPIYISVDNTIKHLCDTSVYWNGQQLQQAQK